MTGTNDITTITAVFVFPVYCKSDESFCVYRYRDTETDKIITAIGANLPNQKNLPVKLCGEWTVNKKDGKRQFSVAYTEPVEPSNKKEIIAYFVSLKCGIGRAKAALIYAKFGDKTWEIVDKHPEELKKVIGISEKIYTRLMAAITENEMSRKLLGLFSRAGVTVSGNTLHRIGTFLGENAVQRLTDNPYCAYGITGFSFDKCDALALSIQYPMDHPNRIKACVKKVLTDATIDGHVCLPKDQVLNEVVRQSGNVQEKVIAAINEACLAKEVWASNGFLYLPDKYKAEKCICDNLVRLMQDDAGPISGLDPIIDDYERSNFKLADSQREAVKKVFEKPVTIITGGPGVGKTTVTNAVLYAHKQVFGEDSKPILLAPTGKAARRMSEATGYPASTIHSAVGWRGDDAEIQCDDAILDGNLVLVDEVSMMDQGIAAILLERIPTGARVVFIGDIDQLPSVGCGYVLHDMIESGVVPTTRLTVIYRQSGDNPIVANAHAINEGKTDLVQTNTFRFLEASSEGEIFQKACMLYIKCVKKYGPDSVVLLNPQRNGTELNVDNFNLTLQQMLNPKRSDEFEMLIGKTTFRAGDKVMETKNTADARNGDVGYIKEISRRPDPDDPSEWMYYAVLEFNNDGIYLEYTPEDMRHVTLAWCTTVHKSQGSEYPTVIQIVSKAHPNMLKRNLVYTGITRARQNVALIGEMDAFKLAVANNAQEVRHTLLAQRLAAAVRKSKQ